MIEIELIISAPITLELGIAPAVHVGYQTTGPVGLKGDKGDKGDLGDSTIWVIGETPSGLINGSNAIFTSAFAFDSASLQVYNNGMLLKILEDYNTSGNNIILNFSPNSNESLLINYIKI